VVSAEGALDARGTPVPGPASVGSLRARRSGWHPAGGTGNLTAALSRPGVISLAGGFPDTSAFGEEAFRELLLGVAKDLPRALQYGPGAGLRQTREAIPLVMAAEGTKAAAEHVFVTTGAQQGLDLVARAFVDEGDVILCEGPTYAGALNAFRAYLPRIEHVATDHYGMVPSAAREVLRRAREAGRRAKFIYVVPNFQNPTGATMPTERRRELLKLAREFDLIVVEDNPYGMLRFEGEPSPTLAALEMEETAGPNRVVYLGTFSKILGPGIRLGWVHAQPGILHKIEVGKQGADLCSPTISQVLVANYLRDADWRSRVESLSGTYRERRDAMLDALHEFMPDGVRWTRPEGGLFVWATLPPHLDTTAMLPRAISSNVAYMPGEGFYAGGLPERAGKNCMRLNFSFLEPEKIREGVKRLAGVVREHMDPKRGPEPGAAPRRGSTGL
jgi:2-aminoadipate transaminase